MPSLVKSSSDFLLVARVGKPHGVAGAVNVNIYLNNASLLTSFVLLDENKNEVKLSSFKKLPKEGLALASFEGVVNREQAHKIMGTCLYIHRNQLPSLEDDSHYFVDLVGFSVVDDLGEVIGSVDGFLDYGAGDIMEITLNNNKQLMIPFSGDIVINIDYSLRHIQCNSSYKNYL